MQLGVRAVSVCTHSCHNFHAWSGNTPAGLLTEEAVAGWRQVIAACLTEILGEAEGSTTERDRCTAAQMQK